MSFPRYPAYKESGVELVREIPAHWSMKRARNLGVFDASGIDKKAVEGEQAVKMLNYLDVYKSADKALRYSSDLMDTTAPSDKVAEHSVREGDILLTPSSETADDIGHAARVVEMPPNVVYSYHLLRFRPTVSADPAFLTYSLNSMPVRSYFASVCTGTTRMVLVREDFKNAPLAIPPVEEQSGIATFLVHETAKIDALVGEQERLIELLKEKRQATISHAVTKGLDPSVPMKDSGNKWLGTVPEHWVSCCLKHIKAETKNAFVDGPFGSNLKSEHFIEDGEVYVIESNFATQGRIDLDDLKTISKEHFATINRSEARGGDIIIAKIGAQYGKASILPDLEKPAVVSGNSLKLTINQAKCDVNFVNWHLANLKSLGVIEEIVNATAQPALSLGEMNNLPMLVPPKSEQRKIVQFLNLKLREIDAFTTEAQLAIILLQERRTALISAAVTGQIDVRGIVPVEASA